MEFAFLGHRSLWCSCRGRCSLVPSLENTLSFPHQWTHKGSAIYSGGKGITMKKSQELEAQCLRKNVSMQGFHPTIVSSFTNSHSQGVFLSGNIWTVIGSNKVRVSHLQAPILPSSSKEYLWVAPFTLLSLTSSFPGASTYLLSKLYHIDCKVSEK